MWVPLYRWMVYFMEIPTKIGDSWGYPCFRKPPCNCILTSLNILTWKPSPGCKCCCSDQVKTDTEERSLADAAQTMTDHEAPDKQRLPRASNEDVSEGALQKSSPESPLKDQKAERKDRKPAVQDALGSVGSCTDGFILSLHAPSSKPTTKHKRFL